MTGNVVDATAEQQPVLVLMGVSGCGKSTVAAVLAGQLGWDLEEGDDLHPAVNVSKMAAGTNRASVGWVNCAVFASERQEDQTEVRTVSGVFRTWLTNTSSRTMTGRASALPTSGRTCVALRARAGEGRGGRPNRGMVQG